tara:strand:+ start:2531 stop:2704 length:174 start_codon:yes stop_codon:yes gene_type:complete
MKREGRKIKVKREDVGIEDSSDFVARILMRDKIYQLTLKLIPFIMVGTLALMVYYGP